MSAGPRPRSARPGDAPALRALLSAPGMAAPLFGARPVSEDLDACVAVLVALPAARGCVRVLDDADRADTLCGFAAIIDGRLAYAVRDAVRRRGHATRLVADCCAARSATPVRAAVATGNAGSARLLEQSGFRFAGRRAGLLSYERPPAVALQSSRSFGIAPGVHHSDSTIAARSVLADSAL